eukprot:2838711-Pleurochrysis_carterae.AAC.2
MPSLDGYKVRTTVNLQVSTGIRSRKEFPVDMQMWRFLPLAVPPLATARSDPAFRSTRSGTRCLHLACTTFFYFHGILTGATVRSRANKLVEGAARIESESKDWLSYARGGGGGGPVAGVPQRRARCATLVCRSSGSVRNDFIKQENSEPGRTKIPN